MIAGQQPQRGCVPPGVGNNTSVCPQVYVRDVKTGRIELVSANVDGQPADGASGDGSVLNAFGTTPDPESPEWISADDRYVAFASTATDLVPNSTDMALGSFGVYVRDLQARRTERASVDSAGQIPGNPTAANEAWEQVVSPDGRFVAYFTVTSRSNALSKALYPPLPAAESGVWLHDRLTGETDYELPVLPRTGASCSGMYPAGSTYSQVSWQPALSTDAAALVFSGPARDYIRNGNGCTQTWLRRRGRPLDAGLASANKLVFAGVPAFASTTRISVGHEAETSPVLEAAGLSLSRASIAYRPDLADLFVSLDLARMPSFATASPASVYGLDLTVDGVRYQVRAAKTGPLTASFELFRRVGGQWTKVDDLSGGYGTTGESVVFALPLRDIGAQHGAHISNTVAFSGIGSEQHVLDVVARIRLTR